MVRSNITKFFFFLVLRYKLVYKISTSLWNRSVYRGIQFWEQNFLSKSTYFSVNVCLLFVFFFFFLTVYLILKIIKFAFEVTVQKSRWNDGTTNKLFIMILFIYFTRYVLILIFITNIFFLFATENFRSRKWNRFA